MKILNLGPRLSRKNLPYLSNELTRQVLSEVANRLSGKKKWCPNETLEQIILNKYTVIRLENREELPNVTG